MSPNTDLSNIRTPISYKCVEIAPKRGEAACTGSEVVFVATWILERNGWPARRRLNRMPAPGDLGTNDLHRLTAGRRRARRHLDQLHVWINFILSALFFST